MICAYTTTMTPTYNIVNSHFIAVTEALVAIESEWIKLPTEGTDADRVCKDPKYQPFGRVRHAVDGTHIPAIVSPELHARFRIRKGKIVLSRASALSVSQRTFSTQVIYCRMYILAATLTCFSRMYWRVGNAPPQKEIYIMMLFCDITFLSSSIYSTYTMLALHFQ